MTACEHSTPSRGRSRWGAGGGCWLPKAAARLVGVTEVWLERHIAVVIKYYHR